MIQPFILLTPFYNDPFLCNRNLKFLKVKRQKTEKRKIIEISRIKMKIENSRWNLLSSSLKLHPLLAVIRHIIVFGV